MRYLLLVSLLVIAACSSSTPRQIEPSAHSKDKTAINVGETDAGDPQPDETVDAQTQTDGSSLKQSLSDPTSAAPADGPIDHEIKEAALQFARDISENNDQVLARVRAAFENPDRDPETVGFILDANASDFEIAFRTTITVLNDSSYVLTYENKFANELPASMATNERIFPAGAVLNPQLEQYIEQLSYGLELGPDDFELDEPIFAEAVHALEDTANENGVYFLELNLGSSDTRYIIPTNQNNYDRWLDVSFQQELTVEGLTWATIWDDIAYNIYDTDTYNLPGILEYQKPSYRDARSLVSP